MKENEDIDNIIELRDVEPVPFLPENIDVDVLRATLRKKRKIDSHLMRHIPPRDEGVTSITAAEASRAFNALLDSDFYLHVDGDFLRLRPEIRRLLALALEARQTGFPVEVEIIRALNRALLHAVYPDETVKTRQHERFMVPEMLKMSVTIASLSPASTESYTGRMLNISAGGMALLLPEKLPEFTYWALRISFADHAEIETVVQIRHTAPHDGQFAHGFQFVSIPSFLGNQVKMFAEDYSGCETRIKSNDTDVCRAACGLHAYCAKPQKRAFAA